METVDSESKSVKDFSKIQEGQFLDDWFVFRNQRHFGPLTTQQVSKFLHKKQISIAHHIWRPGFAEWMPIGSVENFRAIGAKEIDFLSDDEFSKAVKLGEVDKILADKESLTQEEQVVASEHKKPFFGEWFYDSELSFGKKLSFFVTELRNSKFAMEAILAGACGILLIVLMAWAFSGSERDFIKQLPVDLKQKLLALSEIPESRSNVAFELFEKSSNMLDPILVGGTNLPVGTRLKLVVQGVGPTLVGAHRFTQISEMNLADKIFQIPPIRGKNGQYVPSGTYDITVSCLNCKTETAEIYKGEYTFAIKDQSEYVTKLNAFHKQTRINAKEELTELAELRDAITGQYDESVSSFMKYVNRPKAWGVFSTEWLTKQNRLVEVFAQMEVDDFKLKIFYLPLYEAYQKMNRQVFELHVLQDKIVNTIKPEPSIAKQAAQLSQDINLNLIYLKSQLDLMNVNWNSSTHLPSTAGLKLDDLK